MSGPFQHFNDASVKKVWEGIEARSVNGERMTVALVDLGPNAAALPHQHENEQMGFVIQGEMEMTIDGETRNLRAGDTYTIPSNVHHAAVAGPNGAVVCDIFAPTRADWEALPDNEPSPSNWPPKG
ncbi:MAG: cupin domain-containing protein [Candidatus Dormiibacterota bacterium]